MGLLDRILKREESEKELRIGKLTFRISPVERDAEAKIEEYWIERVGVSENGRWVLVGRRYGIFQLYDWWGRLRRLPSKPPTQSITDIVFSGGVLGVVAPPYLVLYYMLDQREPRNWKSVKVSQEGLRPTGGLDIDRGMVIFGVVGERVCIFDLPLEPSQELVDIKLTFSYRNSGIGDLNTIKLLEEGNILLGGSEGVALFSPTGRFLEKLPLPGGRKVILRENTLFNLKGNVVYLFDLLRGELKGELELPHEAEDFDLSPDGRFLFTADPEENRLGVYDLEENNFEGFLKDYGYGVVRVSPDGCIYTSRSEKVNGRVLYYLEKLETNLLDFLYTPERKKQILSNAKELYERFKKALRSARDPEILERLKEYEELRSMDFPLREVRQLILKAEEEVVNRKYELLHAELEEKVKRETLKGEDYERIEELLEEVPQTWKEKFTALRERAKQVLEKKAREALQQVRESLKNTEVADLKDLEEREEVKRARRVLEDLPAFLRNEKEEELLRILQEKVIESRLRTFSIKRERDRVLFGREEFPVFRGEPLRYRWRIKTEDKFLQNGETFVRVVFEREDGVIAEPKRYNNILRQEDLKSYPDWLRRYLRHLEGLCSHEKVKLPGSVSFEETPWFVQNLERFVSLVKEQLAYQEGILILEGDAGVGKNFLVEVFSYLTGRPLYIVPCNSKMEKEDITFVYEFDPRRGTRRVYSDLVKALRTPGAVIYLDEINTLPPSLVKIFNPLFDYRRYLVLSQGEVVRAHPEVVLLGGMNPQNYLGVSELPQDIKSRADVMFVDYPPFEDERGFYYPDEAIILRNYVSGLRELSKEDFTYLWYYLVNGVKTDRGMKLVTPERERKTEMLFELLRIANAIRKAYRSYQTQQSEEPVEFVFSIRDTVRCARRLEKYGDARKVVSETIIPKISSPLEREIVQSIIESA